MAQPLQPSGPTVGLAMTMMATNPPPPAIQPPQPASQPHPTSAPPPSQVRAFWLGRGGAQERGASIFLHLCSSPFSPALAILSLSALDLNTHLPSLSL